MSFSLIRIMRGHAKPMLGAGLALAALLLLGGCSNKVTLYSNIDERQANIMIALLERMGIPCDKTVGADNKVTVLVDNHNFPVAVDILTLFSYPEQHSTAMEMLMKNQSLVSTPSSEQRRYILAKADELANTIERVNGVVSAQVFIVLGEQNPDTGEAKPASASVFIKYRADTSIERNIPKIKDLVFNSVLGLELENVSVVPFPTEEWEFLEITNLADQESRVANANLIGGFAAIVLLAVLLGFGGGTWYCRRKQGG